MGDYYNEHDPFAAQWLRNLIAAGHLPPGDVDERSIEDVVPSDLVGYRHCHFFAGIGGWPYAMQLAGWPDDVPLWTGSCPCQPFSAAGKSGGFADERHLWPAWCWLITQCQPRHIAGEQVASADALRWWDLVATDLEGQGYACTAVDLPAASVGAPHKRSRLFWLADAEHTGHDRPRGAASEPDCDQQRQRLLDGDRRACRVADTEHAIRRQEHGTGEDGRHRPHTGREEAHSEPGTCGEVCDMADTSHNGCCGRGRPEQDSAAAGQPHACGHQPDGCGDAGDGMGDTGLSRLQGLAGDGDTRHESRRKRADTPRPVAPASGADAWADCIWLPCTDGKARPTQPGLFPLATGIPNRVGTLRGAGNAIVPQVAAEVLRAFRACAP